MLRTSAIALALVALSATQASAAAPVLSGSYMITSTKLCMLGAGFYQAPSGFVGVLTFEAGKNKAKFELNQASGGDPFVLSGNLKGSIHAKANASTFEFGEMVYQAYYLLGDTATHIALTRVESQGAVDDPHRTSCFEQITLEK